VSLPRFHRTVFIGACLLYFTTAWFSTGYHSADEHFQIIAFAQWKLGELPAEHLPWEFAAGIRSSLQPWIATVMFKAAALVGLDDPFTRAFLLRLLTAMLALLAMRGLLQATMGEHRERLDKAYILLAYGLWFLPFLAVRYSSEGWSAVFLVFTVTALLRSGKQPGWMWQAGVCAGVAILCRPATALIVLSLLAWMRLVGKGPVRRIATIIMALTATLIAGALLDVLFYARPILTLGHYIALGFGADPAVQFDTLPWWYYPPWIIKYAIPPIGALMLLAFGVLLIHRPRHLLVWMMLPFLIAHSILSHKEVRFLYPLALLAPWLLIEAWSILAGPLVRLPRWVLNASTVVVMIANLLGLAMVVSTPAGEGRVRLAMALLKSTRPGDRIGYVVEPATAWRITLPAFYAPPGTQEVIIGPGDPLPQDLDFLIAPEDLYPSLPPDPHLVPIRRSQPSWSDRLMRVYTWDEGPAPWMVYKVEKAGR